MPEWKVRTPKEGDDQDFWYPRTATGIIEYGGDLAYTAAYIYPTKIEFVYNYGSSGSLKTSGKSSMERGLVLDAHCDNFLPLLSNRLYMMGLGFKTAIESRERNRRHTDNTGVSH